MLHVRYVPEIVSYLMLLILTIHAKRQEEDIWTFQAYRFTISFVTIVPSVLPQRSLYGLMMISNRKFITATTLISILTISK